MVLLISRADREGVEEDQREGLRERIQGDRGGGLRAGNQNTRKFSK